MLEKLFWENNIVLSAVATPMDKKINIYHLKNKRYCKKEFVTLAKLEKCKFSSDLFDQSYRIPDTLFNCPLKIGYVKVSPYVLKKNNKLDGLDIKIVEAITQKLNMSLELTLLSTEAVGNIDDNITFTGSMLQLHENKLDVLIGMIGAYDRQYFFMNMFNPNFLDKILWCVPRQMILESFHLLDFMDTYLWFILPLVFVTSSLLTAKFSQMLLNENNFFKPWSNSFLATFQYILGASVLATPRTVPVRYLIASFLIFTFFVKSALETFLTSSMSSPKYFQKVTSLQDVMKYNAKFYGLEGAKMYLVIFKDQIDHANLKRVIDNWQMCPDLNSCMDNFMMDQNGIASVSDFFIMHYLSQNISQSSQVHCFKSMEFGAIASTFYVPLGFPLFDKFQTIIERLKKGGFLHKWARDHSQIIKSYQRSEMEYNRISAGTSTLKLWNLEYIFRVIIYCYVGALIVFVLEVVIKKWRRKNDFLKIGFLK